MSNSKNVVVAEEPKAAVQPTVEQKAPRTPVAERRYILLEDKMPSLPFKGKQRQIVIAALRSSKEPLSGKEIGAYAKANGLIAVAGAEASAQWHLHQLVLQGFAKSV